MFVNKVVFLGGTAPSPYHAEESFVYDYNSLLKMVRRGRRTSYCYNCLLEMVRRGRRTSYLSPCFLVEVFKARLGHAFRHQVIEGLSGFFLATHSQEEADASYAIVDICGVKANGLAEIIFR